MRELAIIREVLDRVYRWHRVPSMVKARAVLLYYKGMSLRDVQKYLSYEGYKVSIEAIRKWFHAMGKMLRALYTLAVWVYGDETKIKKQKRFPWNAKYETVWRWLYIPFWRLKVDILL